MAATGDGSPHAAPEDAQDEPEPAPSRLFPFEPFKCCPGPVKMLMPGTWQKIQDGTHLTLVFGVLSCFGLIIQTILSLWSLECWSPVCCREVFVLMFVLPCTAYCMKIIAQYDDRLVSKQKSAQQQRTKLTASYNELISDMDGLLTKSAESSAGLAERSFESKRRDFQRFLERVKSRYSNVSTSKGEYEKLIEEFRRFCVNWLRVFAECSIDPTQCPKKVVTEEELKHCASIVEIADMCLERLRVTEVRFISMQREQDQKMISNTKTVFSKITDKATQGAKKLALMSGRDVELADKSRVTVSWLQIGGGQGCSCKIGRNPDSVDGFPKSLGCVCVSITLLSKEHMMLLSSFFVGNVIVLLEVIHVMKPDLFPVLTGEEAGVEFTHKMGVLMVIAAQFSLVVMLMRFEQIDILQQLEREVQKLAKQNEAVMGQQQRMKEFWSNCQQLTELWLYRTVPRLDLYKEIHSQLEDAPPEDLHVDFGRANDQLEQLELHLGKLEMWRKDGDLKTESKKEFGRKINQLCQAQDLKPMLASLEDITVDTASAFKSAGPAEPAPPPIDNTLR